LLLFFSPSRLLGSETLVNFLFPISLSSSASPFFLPNFFLSFVPRMGSFDVVEAPPDLSSLPPFVAKLFLNFWTSRFSSLVSKDPLPSAGLSSVTSSYETLFYSFFCIF